MCPATPEPIIEGLSHEVAHILARHGGERMSQGYAVAGMQQAVQYVMRGEPETRQDRFRGPRFGPSRQTGRRYA